MDLTLRIGPEDDGQLLRRVALSRLQMSNGQFKRAKFEGQLLLDGESVHADRRVSAGQLLVVRMPEDARSFPLKPFNMPLSVPYQDQHLLVVDKPAPFPSTSSGKQPPPTLENAVFFHLGCPADFIYRPVNRLDKGTSGLMAVALHAYSQQRLQMLLHTDDFQREYLAVCEGAPPREQGTITFPIGKAEGATVRREVTECGKPARTQYRMLDMQRGRSLLWLRLDTGRTHQIRVHLQAIGCPIVGDFLYGREDPALPGRFALHSHRIALCHPITGQSVLVESPLPEELKLLLAP